MTPEQLEILLHAINHGEGDRRYISAVIGSALARECNALVAAGFMTGPYRQDKIYPGLGFYYVTEAGQSAARAAMLEVQP